MKAKKIIVPFEGLKEGIHDFDFTIDNDFLGSFENAEIREGDVNVGIQLHKRTRLMIVETVLKGKVVVACDRCLEDFDLEINYAGKLYVKFGEEQYDQEEDIIVLTPNDHQIDLTQYIYECIHLSLPYKRIHPDDRFGNSGCNKEMIQKLNEHKIEEEKDIAKNDPRWDQLKKLITNN